MLLVKVMFLLEVNRITLVPKHLKYIHKLEITKALH